MSPKVYYQDGDDPLSGPFTHEELLKKYRDAEFWSGVKFQFRKNESDTTAPFVSLLDLRTRNGKENPFTDEAQTAFNQRLSALQKEIASLQEMAAQYEDIEKRLKAAEDELVKSGKIQPLPEKIGKAKSAYSDVDPVVARSEALAKVDKSVADNDSLRTELLETLQSTKLHHCEHCDQFFTSHKAFIIHVHSDEHSENVVAATGIFNDDDARLIVLFDNHIKRWRVEDQSRVILQKKTYKGVKNEEMTKARPSEEVMQQITDRMRETIKKESEPKTVENYLSTPGARRHLARINKHLIQDSTILVCSKCEIACGDRDEYLLHCSTYDHVVNTRDTPFELPTLLVGFHYREMYYDK